MTATAPELPRLLRGCLVWRDDRAFVDDEALLVLADWCEDNQEEEVAVTIRAPLKVERTAGMRRLEEYRRVGTGLADIGGDYCIHVSLDRLDRHAAIAWATAHFEPIPRVNMDMAPETLSTAFSPAELAIYRTVRADRNRDGEIGRAGLARIAALARWHVFCAMLDYPPLRLVCAD